MQYYYLLLCCKAGGGGNIIVWVRGGLTGRGEEGKIMMIDFGKRRGESIILFAEKEFKPEGRGRGGAHFFYLFLQGQRGGSIFFLRE